VSVSFWSTLPSDLPLFTTPLYSLLHFSSCPVGHVRVNFDRTCSTLSFVTCKFSCCVSVVYTYQQIHTIKFSDKSLLLRMVIYHWNMQEGLCLGINCIVCLCWHILIVVSTVHRMSNIKFSALQLWRCPFTAFWRFKSSGKDSASLGEWFAVVQESSIPRWLLDSHDEGAILLQNIGNCSPSVTSTKNLIFSNTAVRTSDLTLQCLIIFKIPQILVW